MQNQELLDLFVSKGGYYDYQEDLQKEGITKYADMLQRKKLIIIAQVKYKIEFRKDVKIIDIVYIFKNTEAIITPV